MHLYKNRIYVFGGCNGQCKLNDLYFLDLNVTEEKRYWNKILLKLNGCSCIPPMVDCHSSILVDNVIIIFGGGSEDQWHNDV